MKQVSSPIAPKGGYLAQNKTNMIHASTRAPGTPPTFTQSPVPEGPFRPFFVVPKPTLFVELGRSWMDERRKATRGDFTHKVLW